MPIDYLAESERYRPAVVRTLLVGEAPPPSGRAYFYVPRDLPTGRAIEDDRSLPATIFHHYFRARPRSEAEYRDFLLALRARDVFLVDICDEPIRVRGSDAGRRRIVSEIPSLRRKLETRGLAVPEDAMVFLLARRGYESHVRREFPAASRVTWKKFRMNPEENFSCRARTKGDR